MKYGIESEKTSAYLQLYTQLKRDIVSGVFPYGAKLPSKRILAEETGVSVITVEHAYALLIDEGYIEPRERSGYFVVYKSSDFISSSEGEPMPKIISTVKGGTGEFFPFPSLAKTMRRVILDYGERLLCKPESKGVYELRLAICKYLKRTVNIDAVPEQVVVGAGAEYLYSLIIKLIGKDKIYAVEDPSYKVISEVYFANGVKFEKLALSGNGIKSEELLKTKASVLHTTPYNSYPSLISATASKRREYLEWAKARDGYIIEDNYDSELTVSKKHEETLFSISENENVIYVNTFSKTVAPSLRVGYMILPKSLVSEFDRRLGCFSCTAAVFEQYLIYELLQSGDFERHINRVRRQRRKSGYIK